MSTTAPSRQELKNSLGDLTLRDEHRLRRRLDRARTPDALASLSDEIDAARGRVARRLDSVPAIDYPDSLPVSQRRDDIAQAISEHQVVIVAGETGSGKTTQIPKICLELGRGVRGLIGHTQPRRLAARTVAERIAEELHSELGETVGYTVRFTDQVSDGTLVKLMTDGILLAEIQRDRMLRRYDTLIIDEAHERSLNIDFILGYLRQLLPRRPDLKVIITSATIDPQRFAQHFATDGVPAPIVEVSGRTFPVEMRYRPLTVDVGDQSFDRDPVDAVCEAVEELSGEGDGDILVFLSGEREIRDTADALRDRRLRGTEIVPLYARLSAAEQHKVFTPHTGRRVVLSTNVAETSLTVPGIRYVVDPGTARISRYSVRTKVQRLPIEPISQASARQRSGRCGRVAEGICIRLYSEEDFEARPAFTEPEILRTNLASVILQMTALGLGDIAAFPFVQPPDPRAVRDGIGLLEELGAIERKAQSEQPVLTAVGRELAQIPVDPRMARMLVEAHRNGCLAEVLVIVSALSIQDVRERPAEFQQAADEKHARFTVENSDFLAFLELWKYLREQRNELSSNQFRKMCRNEFLHWLRIREWQDLHGQLRQITRGLGWNTSETPGGEAAIHQSLLAGLLSHIGLREGDKRDFLGARGSRFAVFPGSSLFKKPPRWVMAAELVETSRLWARMSARIEPEWAEKLAPHLVKRTYSEPHWSSKRGAAMAYERVTLYGIPLVARRAVTYSTIDPEASRDLFIRHALVQGEWQTQHAFFHANRALLDDVEELEHRARRRDILVDDDTLYDFYDRRVGPEAVSARHFDSWWKVARRTNPDLLTFTQATVVNAESATVLGGDYPDAWRQGDMQFPLTYQFEPGNEDDGVTARIPIALLAGLRPVGFDWLVPGMRVELVTALIKTLPKTLRRQVVPAPDFAAAALAAVKPRSEPLTTAMARELSRLGACRIDPKDFDVSALPDHLRMTFAAVDEKGAVLGRDKDLVSLRKALAPRVQVEVAKAASNSERPPALTWTPETLGSLEATVTRELGGQKVTGYPALVPEGDGVAVRVLSTASAQRAAMRAGTRRLLLAAVPTQAKTVTSGLSNAQRLALGQNPDGSLEALIDDCRNSAANQLIAAYGTPVRTPEQFDALVKTARAEMARNVAVLLRLVAPVLEADHRLAVVLDRATGEAADDVREQRQSLLFPGFVADIGATRLREVPRYLTAAVTRLEAFPGSAPRDQKGMDTLDRVYAGYERMLAALPEERHHSAEVDAIHWMIEELRVSLFAQTLGTPIPVSEKRVMSAMQKVR
ncbi:MULTISPECIES: ATP-dependent RNA helicase HrpA [unclassified Rhodococcus (in: high G+C Gram-positive bacteria)]|uniref:ATP-dependent RNA helicase HrpA n=1 Tax=unclassified Rhodococcus (in: high G+C Gram-positive bacteria) TaxID=192944 RepID=UPI001639A915|nr:MULTISPECIES: ATP-dependent RNA helicase HrpA [unclassified Rhodococcus (in: high G+C Gram-positive bacteria)]MBC2643899.1 ATP-dependent RNA helicase HrpA [Rhodococcus sp. 3A]MBC2891361.1 ATP-dependent RNA helicase HrpA [Rhodococcus sp. 4CII]